MNFLAAFFLVSSVRGLDLDTWCYHQPTCNDSTWPVIAPAYCDGIRQSPINIVSKSAKPNSKLTPFIFQNYRNTSALKKIINTGNTVQVNFESGVRISNGGLSEPYDCLQLHLHWGNGSSVPGSEHTVDGKRYAMELNIVCTKASHKGNTALAIEDPTGLAALCFFIEEKPGEGTGQPESWSNLTSYLPNIINSGDSVPFEPGVSLDDLLVGVDRTKYYRYLGSLTTPDCNEAVVWTVFKESVKVNKDLIDRFSTTVHFSDGSSPFMTNTFRGTQRSQEVTTQRSRSSSTSTICHPLVLMALGFALGLC